MLSPRKGWVKKQVKLDLKKCSSQSHRNWMMLLCRICHAPKSNPHEGRKPIWKELIISPDVDPFEDMDVEGLFDEAVPPQAEKQIPAGPPPSYDEMIKELGDDPPPEYEEDDSPDYALAPGDETEAESSETEEANKLLGSLNIRSYDTVDATLPIQNCQQPREEIIWRNAFFPKQSIEEIS